MPGRSGREARVEGAEHWLGAGQEPGGEGKITGWFLGLAMGSPDAMSLGMCLEGFPDEISI